MMLTREKKKRRFKSDWSFTVVPLFFVFTLEAGNRFINTVEMITAKKSKHEEYTLSTMATSSTSRALHGRHFFGVEKVLSSVCWVIVCRDEVTHYCKIRKLSAPSPPFTNCTQPPTPLGCKILTTPTAERVGSIG